MTLGIAAICEQGSSAVMVADRMVSTGIAGLELETENRKLIRLYPQTMVATTGTISDARFALDIFQGLADLSGAASTAQVADHLRTSCEQLRMQQAETMYIRRLLGIGLAEFREKCLSTRANKVITDIYNKIAGHNLSLEFLLARIDGQGAHLFSVTDMRVLRQDSLAFYAIGSGSIVAQVVLARRGHDRSRSLAETIYSLYDAKRAAESVSGVGHATDLCVLRPGKDPEFLPNETIETLQGIYDRLRPPTLGDDDLKAIGAFVA